MVGQVVESPKGIKIYIIGAWKIGRNFRLPVSPRDWKTPQKQWQGLSLVAPFWSLILNSTSRVHYHPPDNVGTA
jgi:hypothetical protein